MHFSAQTTRRRALALALLAGLALAVPGAGRADDPKFAYGKQEEIAKLPPWAATIQAGFGLTTGNAQSLNLTGAGSVSHRFGGSDLLALSGSVAFLRSTVQSALDTNGDGAISPNEVFSITQNVSEAWEVRLRYDHFFDLNAIYAFAFGGGNVPAGNQFVGGVQAGYSRALWKTAKNELVVEAGLDYSYQRFVVGDPSSVNIAALRAYVGYTGTPNPDLTYNASAEWLGNLNPLDMPSGHVNTLGDNRLNLKLGVTWKMWEDGSLGFRFRAIYDSAPSPRPPPSGFTWAPGYLPLAESWDTFTELVLVYKLL